MAGEKILLIDDEADIRTVARMSLQMVGGFQVIEAEGGMKGVELACSEQPALILLDAMMPGMDGPQTLQALKSNPLCQNIPIVFVTAKAQRIELERLEALGAVGVLSKPFDPMKFPESVRAFLAS